MYNETFSAALVGKVKFLRDLDEEAFLRQISEGFYRITKEKPSVEQVNAWKESWKHLKDLFFKLPEDITAIFEYKLPMSQERIDVIFLGSSNSENAGFILELKGWKSVNTFNSSYIVKTDLGENIHPELQVLNYLGKIKFSSFRGG